MSVLSFSEMKFQSPRRSGCALMVGPWLAAIGLACGQPPAERTLTYPDLVGRLTDLKHLATLPEAGEATAQWSSYDRASRYDGKSGKYQRWDANGDNNGVIREEDGRVVMAEMTGPGCIWRIWSAEARSGHVKIYLDGASDPAVDLPFASYFDGKSEPFTRPALVHVAAQGLNNYTPIPYQKSCKVVAEPGWGAYYHFVYSTFPPGTRVPTFQRDLASEDRAALDEADRQLNHCGPREFPAGVAATRGAGELAGNDGADTAKLDGPGAISCLRVKFDPPLTAAEQDVLREMTLQIRWDGEVAPSVWAPLGDFFGTAPGANVYRSLPCGYTAEGWFYANWFMPFAKSAEVTIRNEGRTPRRLQYEIYAEPLPGDLARYGRFHAKWHRDEFLTTRVDRKIDWPLLKVEGRGRFVGVMLHVWNPRGGWWGEGDEKFWVDGEKFPSTFGTGSEDYFGYAWCNPTPFAHAFHNQTFNDGHNKGQISVNRWHVADQIPFQKSFAADLEKYFPNSRPTLYAAMAYWYQQPRGHDAYAPVPLSMRVGYQVLPPVRKVAGAIEGESLPIMGTIGGKAEVQDMVVFGGDWSGDAQLWWRDAQPGNRLQLDLVVTNAARYEIWGQFTKARDYGIVQFGLDGLKLGAPIDFYHDGVISSGEVKLGVLTLTAGAHPFEVQITGANERAEKSYMFGLDYLRLVEVK